MRQIDRLVAIPQIDTFNYVFYRHGSSFTFSAPCNQSFVRFAFRLNLLRQRSTPLPLFLTRHHLLRLASLHLSLTFPRFPPPPLSSSAPLSLSLSAPLMSVSSVCLLFCEFVLEVTEVRTANRLCGNHPFLLPSHAISLPLSLSLQQVFFVFLQGTGAFLH